MDGAPLISVVIVNYRVPDLLRQALRSLHDADLCDRTEILVIDNASGDNSRQQITGEFPGIVWIGLKSNIGFGKACNVGAQSAHGEFVLFLNPDTMVSRNTLSACVDFMTAHPDAGIMGPKILNTDGTLQLSCRRSFPTPLVAFYHYSGLAKYFPASRRFGRYNLTYLDPQQPAQVDAVSGSFMFMRLPLFLEIGGFDEMFFMYGEDLDLCMKVRQRGCGVWYNPATTIIHLKGGSSQKRVLKTKASFYEAMILFSRKYRHANETFMPAWLVYIGIVVIAAFHLAGSILRSFTACFIDLGIINVALWLGISVRYYFAHMPSPYTSDTAFWMLVGMHFLLSDCFLVSYWLRGIYTKSRYSAANALVSGLIASAGFMAFVYFIGYLAFSRIAFAFVCAFLTIGLVLWRELAPRITGTITRRIFSTGRVIIIGNSPIAQQLILNVESDASAEIVGIVWPVMERPPGEFHGYPVLGTIHSIRQTLERNRIDLLLIATSIPWYSYIIEALTSPLVRHLAIRWVSPEVLAKTGDSVPKVIPLQNFSV